MNEMDNKPLLDFFKRHGVEMLELQLGCEAPHIGVVTLTFGIFDGFALAVVDKGKGHNQSAPEFQLIKLTYPKLSELNQCEYYRDLIRENRFSGQIAVDCKLYPEDGAVCLGVPHEVTFTEFENSLKTGLAQIGKKPKHLHIYRNEQEFLAAMDGKIYGIVNTVGNWFCDLYANQFMFLTDEEMIVDTCGNFDYPVPQGSESDYILTDESHRQFVYDRRIEIIKLYK